MTREEAKELFRSDKDAYGKPRHIIKNIDRIYDDFEAQQLVKESDSLPCVSGITEDFKHLKELVEGELLTYSHFPPKDDIAQIHKETCEEALKKIEKYYR